MIGTKRNVLDAPSLVRILQSIRLQRSFPGSADGQGRKNSTVRDQRDHDQIRRTRTGDQRSQMISQQVIAVFGERYVTRTVALQSCAPSPHHEIPSFKRIFNSGLPQLVHKGLDHDLVESRRTGGWSRIFAFPCQCCLFTGPEHIPSRISAEAVSKCF